MSITLTSWYVFHFLTVDIINQALKTKLEEKKPTLEDAQGLCDKLTDQNKDEPLVVAAIKNKFDKVESPYEDLRAKITELEGRLQAAQIRSQEFTVSFSDFKDKLQDMEELSANLQPVSAVYDTLKQQRSDDEVKRLSNIVQFRLTKARLATESLVNFDKQYFQMFLSRVTYKLSLLANLSKDPCLVYFMSCIGRDHKLAETSTRRSIAF